MASIDEKARRPRRSTIGAASTRSTHSSLRPDVGRIISGNHLDDHSHYHEDHVRDDESAIDTEMPSATVNSAASKDKDARIDLEAGGISERSTDGDDSVDLDDDSDDTEVFENRDGIEDIRDRDMSSKEELERKRSLRSLRRERSSRDPNLVTWDGPDDPKNPKNWSTGRKWAATLIGMSTFVPGTHKCECH
jgi:hypothetical protein